MRRQRLTTVMAVYGVGLGLGCSSTTDGGDTTSAATSRGGSGDSGEGSADSTAAGTGGGSSTGTTGSGSGGGVEPGIVTLSECELPAAFSTPADFRNYTAYATDPDASALFVAYSSDDGGPAYRITKLIAAVAEPCELAADSDFGSAGVYSLPEQGASSEPSDLGVDLGGVYAATTSGPTRVWPAAAVVQCDAVGQGSVAIAVAGDTLFTGTSPGTGIDRWSIAGADCTRQTAWGTYQGESEVGIAVDTQGQLHVMAAGVPRVHLFSVSGAFIATYGDELGDTELGFSGRHAIMPRPDGVVVQIGELAHRFDTDGVFIDSTDLETLAGADSGAAAHLVSSPDGNGFVLTVPPTVIGEPDPPDWKVYRITGL